ncbi:MAG: ABC transporter ATP-binding protein [Myxococcales bacterium]|nr:ABC transporter ATP-binding protein [Myxococcales bacterium]
MIEVEGLTKYYGGKRAIHDLNFRIEKGEVVGFLGLNGAGKTTTLRILACLILPSSGSVRIDGLEAGESAHEIRKLLGFLPDTPPLYDEMAVGDYLRFVAELKDVAPRDVSRRVGEALELCGLTEVRLDPISTLSHGYRQRAGIAQAIVHKPSLLILDEPTSGLDPVQIGEMRELIRRLAGDHTILLSSHILTEISQTCDRLLVIHEGLITADGTEEAIRKRVASAGSDEGIIEVELEATGSGDPGPAAKAQCEKVTGVLAARIVRSEGRRISLEIEAIGDQRAALARTLVESGHGLLRLDRRSLALESIFQRLVHPAPPPGGPISA